MTDLACVILASGYSRRYGADKLLESDSSERCLIRQTIELYQPLFPVVHVVARPDNLPLMDVLNDENVMIIENSQSEHGMSQSIVASVLSCNTSTGWLFVLADMPYVKASTIENIRDSARTNRIIQPVFEGKPGNPIAIGHDFAPKLRQLTGDNGAKQIVQNAGEALMQLELDDAGIHQDIDTPNDWRSLDSSD